MVIAAGLTVGPSFSRISVQGGLVWVPGRSSWVDRLRKHLLKHRMFLYKDDELSAPAQLPARSPRHARIFPPLSLIISTVIVNIVQPILFEQVADGLGMDRPPVNLTLLRAFATCCHTIRTIRFPRHDKALGLPQQGSGTPISSFDRRMHNAQPIAGLIRGDCVPRLSWLNPEVLM